MIERLTRRHTPLTLDRIQHFHRDKWNSHIELDDQLSLQSKTTLHWMFFGQHLQETQTSETTTDLWTINVIVCPQIGSDWISNK